MGVSRPDLAAYYGRNDFNAAGFSLSANLLSGTYDIVAYGFSTVAGGFNSRASARITVVNLQPTPKMSIDLPARNSVVQQMFAVAGWAVDLGAPSGPGVAALHVWAYPASGAAPVFVGATGMNVSRPDVGAYFGDPRFNGSGFALQGNLPPGGYTLVVFAWSTATATFNQTASIPITVQ